MRGFPLQDLKGKPTIKRPMFSIIQPNNWMNCPIKMNQANSDPKNANVLSINPGGRGGTTPTTELGSGFTVSSGVSLNVVRSWGGRLRKSKTSVATLIEEVGL